MTVSASNLLAVPPGAPPSPSGAGAIAPSGVAALFEGMLAGAIQAESGGWPAAGAALKDEPPAEAANTDETSPAIDSGVLSLMFAPAATPLAPPAAPASSDMIEAEAPATVSATAGWGDRAFAASRPGGDLAPVANGIEDAPGSAATVDVVDTAAPEDVQPPVGAGRIDDLADLIAKAGRRESASVKAAAPVGPVVSPPATVAAQAAIQSATVASVAPAVVAPAAPATVDEGEAAEVGPPPPGSIKAASTDGETRRGPGAARTDRRDAATRAGGASSSPFAPKSDPLAATLVDATSPATGEKEVSTDAPDLAGLDIAEATETRQPALIAETPARAMQATTAAIDAAAVRGSPETVARMAADIVRKLDGQSTRFDLQLDPAGMGKVDVAIEIDRTGKLTAAMSFDSAQSASDLRGRAGELRLALEQAGFDIAEGGLTFDLAGQGAGPGGREAGQQERAWNGRAFQRAQSGADDADLSLAATPSTPSRWTRSGVDIRI